MNVISRPLDKTGYADGKALPKGLDDVLISNNSKVTETDWTRVGPALMQLAVPHQGTKTKKYSSFNIQ